MACTIFSSIYRTFILTYTSKIPQCSIHSMTLSESAGTIIYTEPGEPIVAATVSRDTAVIVKLTPAQTFDLIEQCLVWVHPTTGSDATSATETVVDVSGNVLFIEGLLPRTEYSY